jgi:CRP-like cAMP-binding protein
MDSGRMQDIQVPKGSLIFRQGDAGDQMFLIGDGRVRLFLESEGHQKDVGVLGPGDFFGELALLRDAPRSATAEAVEDTTLLPISRDVFAMLVQDDLDTVFRMMSNLGERLARTNIPIQILLMRLGRIRTGLCALKRLLPADAPSAVIDVVALAQEAGMGLRAATEAVEAWVEAGVGMYDEGRWRIDSAEQVIKLIDALSVLAEA